MQQIVDHRLFPIVSSTTVTEQEDVLNDLRNSKDGSFRYSSACFCHVHNIATGNAIKDLTFVCVRLLHVLQDFSDACETLAFLRLSSEPILLKKSSQN